MRIISIIILSVLSFLPLQGVRQRALLVGIGDYDTRNTGWGKIHGDADVALLSPLFEKRGFKVSSLVNARATKKNIISALNKLADECSPGDKVYFQFSGHGQRVKDFNGDEEDGMDEALVCYDACRTPGYLQPPMIYKGENHILDDELAPLLQKIRRKIGKEGFLFIVFDACFSRGLEKGSEEEEDEIPDDYPRYVRGTDKQFLPADNSYLLSIPPPKAFGPGPLTAIVSASLETERNFEVRIGVKYYGTLTYAISLLLKESADFASWIEYFKTESYRKSGVFPPFQHPSIIIYK